MGKSKKEPVPWLEVKAKYETGGYTIQQLAQEYKFNASYGRRKASKEGWKRGETALLVTQEVTERVTKKIIGQEAEKQVILREEYSKIITNLRRAAANELFGGNTSFNRLKELKITSEIIRNCRIEDWELHQIQEVAKKLEQEIMGEGGGPIELKLEKEYHLIQQIINDPQARQEAVNRWQERFTDQVSSSPEF